MNRPPTPHHPEVSRAAAPTGTLRAAINLGNVVLAQRSPTGELEGASVRLAREAARRLSLPLELVPFDAAGRVFEALAHDAWDVAFMAIDPLRAEQICFTEPYVLIESTYLVRENSRLHSHADIDVPGVRVAASVGSAYELYLRRTLQNAALVSRSTPEDAFAAFCEQRLEAIAGVRPALLQMRERQPGLRVVSEPFLSVQQAIGLPRRSVGAIPWFQSFIAEALAGGFVQRALDETGQAASAVVPAK